MIAYPSRIALPNGRGVPSSEPPRKVLYTSSANVFASSSVLSWIFPVAPPIEIVSIFPFFWHARIPSVSSLASSNAELGSTVADLTFYSRACQRMSAVWTLRGSQDTILTSTYVRKIDLHSVL